MRFIHTADWHLGRRPYGFDVLSDQEARLAFLLDLAKAARPDALVIAGDVFDRAVPPPDAVRLLDAFLSELVLGMGIPALVIAGNHDGAERLAFGSALLRAQGLHVKGPLGRGASTALLEDASGPVAFDLVPFHTPASVRSALHAPEVQDPQAALRRLLMEARAATAPGCARRVAVCHAFLSDAHACLSERELGCQAVGAEVFDGWSYAALGHQHRPHSFSPAAACSGSLLRFGEDEADHEKSVRLVEVCGDGELVQEDLVLSGGRSLRVLEGTLSDLAALGRREPSDDLVVARLTDAARVPDALGRLREVWPNLAAIRRSAPEPSRPPSPRAAPARADLDSPASLGRLLLDFHEAAAGRPPDALEAEILAAAVESACAEDGDGPRGGP